MAAAEVAAVLAELDAVRRETLDKWSSGDSAPMTNAKDSETHNV